MDMFLRNKKVIERLLELLEYKDREIKRIKRPQIDMLPDVSKVAVPIVMVPNNDVPKDRVILTNIGAPV